MRRLAMVLLALVVAVPAFAVDEFEDITAPSGPYQEPDFSDVWAGPRDVLFDQSALITCAGCGAGGADVSWVQTIAFGMSLYGFGAQVSAGNWMADDFTVPAGQVWNLDSITFFSYQTNSPTTPTINDARVVIYDAAPPGGIVVWGDETTNVLADAAWSQIYRTLDTDPGSTARPIMAVVAAVDAVLEAGDYWVGYQFGGTLSSGPWVPPVTVDGFCESGNAMQRTSTGWAAAIDSGSGCPQGVPFIVSGTVGGTPVDESTWGKIKSTFRF